MSAPQEPQGHEEELSLEELERHIAEAEQLHLDLTARLDATAQD